MLLHFLQLLKQLNETEHMNIILITHDLGVVASLAKRIEVMYGGLIMEEGTTEEKEVTGTIDEIKDFMFVVTDENDTPYSFTFEEKPEGLENVSNGDTVTVRYTGTISEVDPFEGEVISVEKAQ